ncbi:phosphonate ABC transporter, permease protein PhnE [Radiobacillus kanasensis]|uniref:phosphonate ABC transporter, permease protein PhnE n=1 Tax=Radiobacillus kanasensis TaxID=2844358 RepID=UPI001E5FC98D|nr:phosphonate ABC transporter, permease protein PhnE [Radiobacillus kanasensis]UFT99078.1 phosphonate ABC transporter, permease protein PhnE [Radiobacillus kanasensis]
MNPIKEQQLPQPPSKLKPALTIVLILLAIWLSAMKTDVQLSEFFLSFGNMWDLIVQMFPPNWAYFNNIVVPMLETLRMAVIGTTVGAIFSIPIALFSASNMVQLRWVHYPVRFVLNLIRTVPELLLAAIFVAIFGLGPLPGILAISLFSVGIIAKLTYESIESIDKGPLEAMTAVGANKIQWIVFAVIPQVAAYFISYVLYTFEVNVRAAAILGLVGAGGIGLYYDHTLGFLEYDKTNMIIIFTLVVVLIIDYISTKLREKLL